MKKGGKLQKQRRFWYEYFPGNKLLVWRAEEKKKDGIKGAVVLDKSVKLEKNGAVLTVKTQAKSHPIVFDTPKQCEEWYTGLTQGIQ
jgi:hypothetical protein